MKSKINSLSKNVLLLPIRAHPITQISVVYNNSTRGNERPIIKSSGDALVFLLEAYNRETIGLQEQFVVMYLNRANKILGIYHASSGGITGTVFDIRLILGVALTIAATSMIISHNHPSGNLTPSSQDQELTQKVKQAAIIMEIKLLDHLIIEPSGTQYYSFADEGIL